MDNIWMAIFIAILVILALYDGGKDYQSKELERLRRKRLDEKNKTNSR